MRTASLSPLNQVRLLVAVFFFFNDTATTEIYTLSLHDALPICYWISIIYNQYLFWGRKSLRQQDRKSTRLNSSHGSISYAVFCLKKKINRHLKTHHHITTHQHARLHSPCRRPPRPVHPVWAGVRPYAPCCRRTFFFFFNDTATTEIYTLSLHDALPI